MAIFDTFITLKEAGAKTGYHPDYIGALIRGKKVKGKKVGKNWFVSQKEVEEYLSTKHYVSVKKVFQGSGKILAVLVVVIFTLAVYAMYSESQSNPSSKTSTVKVDLLDTVSPQGDVAIPIP